MFFYVNDIVFAFTESRKKDAKNLIRRLKDIFDMRDLNSLNFFLDVRILQKLDTIWLIQNFYMNKLIKDYVINIKYKATTLLSYQSLMSYIDEMNQEKVYVYRQKIKSICYSVIITESNIIKIAFELARHFTNSDSKHLKAANHCIKYLHVIKFLVIRYSNSKNEEFSSQISSSNKEKSNKKMSSTSNSKLNKKTSSNIENNDKQIFEKTTDAFFCKWSWSKKRWRIYFQIVWWYDRLNCQKTTHRLDFHHRSEIFLDVTRWQKAHLMNTFLSEVEVWFESKDNDLQR
jgi:hypothetical protein